MNFSNFINKKDYRSVNMFTKNDIENKSKTFLNNDNCKNSIINENNAKSYNYEKHEKSKNDDILRQTIKTKKNDNNMMNNIDLKVERFYNDIQNRKFDE